MKIYKYAPANKALLILKSESVALSHPYEFKDIRDCAFKQSEKDKRAIRKLLKDFVTLSILIELTKIKEIEDDPCMVFFNSKLKKFKEKLERNPIYNGTLGLGLVFNYMAKKRPEIIISFDTQFEKYQKDIDEAIERIKNDALISCFCKSNDSLSMWNEYAGNHKGVCFEYERPTGDDFLDVIYRKKKPSMELYNSVAHTLAPKERSSSATRM